MKIKTLCTNAQIVTDEFGNQVLFSYDTAIAKIKDNKEVVLDSEFWDYSKTTGKHRNTFLGMNKLKTQKAINSGAIVFANLND